MYFSNLIRRLTFGKEILNFGKNSAFYKTNHFRLRPPVHRPSPLVETIGKPAKRIVRASAATRTELVAIVTKRIVRAPDVARVEPVAALPKRTLHTSAAACVKLTAAFPERTAPLLPRRERTKVRVSFPLSLRASPHRNEGTSANPRAILSIAKNLVPSSFSPERQTNNSPPLG